MSSRLRKSQVRIPLMGAAATLVFLAALAIGTRTVVRRVTLRDIDDDIETLAVAIGSDLELSGLAALESTSLHAGVERNTMAFRLEHHSALLLDHGRVVAVAGDLVRNENRRAAVALSRHSERPFTAIDPFSGQRRESRFRVLRLGGNARGATLIVFRSIEPTLELFARIDLALLALVLAGVAGSAAILANAVRRALGPVETVTRIAESTDATDLSKRVGPPGGGGEEVEHLTRVINSLFERLERAFASQRRLVADAAHELKTPAAAILAEAQEALREDTPPAQRTLLLASIAASARELARETDALLTLARGESGLREWVRTDIRELAEQSIAAIHRRAAERGIRIETSFEGDLSLDAEPSTLRRALDNLLLNAVTYGNSLVEVSARGDAHEVALTVADDGPGVPLEDRERIFQPFVRLANARKSSAEGSGLGLAIVAQAVRNHDGSISVEDRAGGGVAFTMHIPRRT
jgi:signal transduction histidine kinase